MGLYGSKAGRKHGIHQRTIDRIMLLVRLEKALPAATIQDLCSMVGIKPTRYSTLTKLPVYKIIKNQFMSGIITDLEGKVQDTLGISRKTLEYAVPIAMQGLLDQALNAKDERVKNKAFNDILDRDGNFAKVRRQNVVVSSQTGKELTENDKAAAELISAMAAPSTADNNKGFKDPDISSPPITTTKQ